MVFIAIALLLGCSSLWLVEILASPDELLLSSAATLIVFSLSHAFRARISSYLLHTIRMLTLMSVTAIYAQAIASFELSHRLPISQEKQNVSSVGVVCSVVTQHSRRQTFDFCPIINESSNNASISSVRKIRVSHYQPVEVIYPGEWLELNLRIKGPYSRVNPSGFDFERYAFLNDIDATATVLSISSIPANVEQNLFDSVGFIQKWRINRLKKLAYQQQRLSTSEYIGWHMALLYGEKGWLTEEQRKLLQDSGTAHLMAISGLHIGFIFFWIYFIAKFCWSRSVWLTSQISAVRFGLVAGLFSAIMFAINAGLPISTQRALIAISIFVLSRLLLFKLSSSSLLAATTIAVLLYDPLAVLSEAFWLSYIAVAIIFFISAQSESKGVSFWIKLQIFLSTSMAVVAGLLFGELSLNASIANLISIPLVAWIILPMELLWLFLSFLIDFSSYLQVIANALINCIDWCIEWLQYFLRWINRFTGIAYIRVDQSVIFIVLVIMALVYYRLRSNSVALLCLCASLPLVFSAFYDDSKEGLRLIFFDVGQGLSVAGKITVEGERFSFLYDTGFGENLNNANLQKLNDDIDNGEISGKPRRVSSSASIAKTSVIPSLKSLKIDQLDLFILSHSNSDHVGGFMDILDVFKVKRMVLGETLPSYSAEQYPCYGRYELIEGWSLEWFSANSLNTKIHGGKSNDSHMKPTFQGNDASCVLLLEAGRKRILLTGDIEQPAELEIVKGAKNTFPVSLMSVPHHGSLTSSSWTLVATSQPRWAIVNAGKLNAFNHPRPEVVQRYESVGSKILNTADLGAIDLQISTSGHIEWTFWRKKKGYFWRQR